MPLLLQKFMVEEHVKNALKEDIGFGDITTDFLFSDKDKITAKINTRQDGILCGIDVAEIVFKFLNNDIKFRKMFKDG